MKLPEVNTAALSAAVKRLGIVVYISILSLAGLGAFLGAMFGDELSFSMTLFATGSALTGLVIALEVVRRTILYIVTSENFVHSRVPRSAKIFLAIGAISLLLSGLVYLAYDLPAKNMQAAEALAEYKKAVEALPAARAAVEACLADAENKTDTQSRTESSACRRAKLGYNSCMESGVLSHTQCIYIHDYESACAEIFGSLYKAVLSNSCDGTVRALETIVENYQFLHSEMKPQ